MSRASGTAPSAVTFLAASPKACAWLMIAWFLMPVVRKTEMIATPIEEPICWVMLSSVEPRATSCARRDFSAEVMIGIIVPPMPRPMRKRTGRM